MSSEAKDDFEFDDSDDNKEDDVQNVYLDVNRPRSSSFNKTSKSS